jgi:arylsulfatase A-like enzyme
MHRPNVILLAIDSMRWDRIGRNGYSRPVTPNIDAMMSRSIYCQTTYILSPSTVGAFPSLMTVVRFSQFNAEKEIPVHNFYLHDMKDQD